MKDYIDILKGKASQEERKEFFKELENDDAKKDAFIETQTLWTLTGIRNKETSAAHKTKAFNNFWSAANPAQRTIQFQNVSKYAAVFVLAMGLTLLLQYAVGHFNKTPNYSYQSQKGGVTEFKLADGTSIWLNTDSKLEIFEGENKVEANLSGEAFFNVIHNESRQFIVNAGGLKIEDLGTQFNVSAYKSNSLVKTTLLEGSVALFDKTNKPLQSINPGQVAFYHKIKNTMWVKDADIDATTAWTEGKFAFIDKSLGAICNELEKWYDVNIVIEDELLRKTKYSCMLKRPTTVVQVLEIMQKTSNINFKIYTKEGKEEVIITANK